MKFVILALVVLIAASCSHAPKKKATPIAIHHEFLVHPNDPKKHIEIYWAKPDGDGPWPAIILIHGHQAAANTQGVLQFQQGALSPQKTPSTPGAKIYVDYGALDHFARRGLVAIAVSQPGYGLSDGPPDFCGPFTQAAVRQTIAHFRAQPFVMPDKIALEGTSRGAVVAAMVAAQDPMLAGAVLLSGTYDLVREYSWLKHRGAQDPRLASIARSIETESGTTRAALKARSALYHVNQIKIPLLILNGELDPLLDMGSTQDFYRRLLKRNIPVRAYILPHEGHALRSKERHIEVRKFLDEYILTNRS